VRFATGGRVGDAGAGDDATAGDAEPDGVAAPGAHAAATKTIHASRRRRTTGHYNDHMTKRMSATEVKARILSLLDDVASGEEVEVTKHGRTVARIVPARGPHALRDKFKDVVIRTAKDDDLYSTGVRWNTDLRRTR